MNSDNQIKTQKTTRLFLLGSVVALLLILHFYHPPQRGLWTQAFFNFLHAPVFGLVAICLYSLLPAGFQPFKRVAFALVATCVLGVFSEIAQIQTVRDASFEDLIADCLGAASFLVAAIAFSPSASISLGRRVVLSMLAVTLIGWPLFPLAKVSVAYIERNSQVPTLVSFEARAGDALIRKKNVAFRVVQSPVHDQNVAMVVLGEGSWPGVAFHDLWPDWRDYSTLVIEISVDGDEPLELNVRVHDLEHRQHTQSFADRFNKSFTLGSGTHALRIPLDDIQKAPKDREMDLTQVSELILFSSPKYAGRTFYIHEIRLQ